MWKSAETVAQSILCNGLPSGAVESSLEIHAMRRAKRYRLGLVSAGLAVALLSTIPSTAKENVSETYKALNLFGDVFDRVRTQYVEEVSEEKLIEAAINGMLSSLDPHSSYLNRDSFEDMQVQTKGEFGGLGIEVTMEGGLVKVVSPIDDTPAFRAGLQSGDLISHLDGVPIQGLTLAEAVEKMRGKPDTDIKLIVRRGDQAPFEVTLTRAIIKIQSVRSRLEGDIGYIRITSFSQQTESGLRKAYKKLLEESPKGSLSGIILDLRNNPGGLLDQAIAVSDAFLERGEIVSTRGRNKDDAQRFNATPGDLTNGLPVVVLINGGSASASEIVAGALQDHHRALLMGTRSFGKGSVQTIQPIPEHGAIRLTTARYYTPSGTSIQAKGISPDIEVQPAKVEVIDVSKRRREADLRGALANPNTDPGQNSPASPNANPPAKDESGAEGPNKTEPSDSEATKSDAKPAAQVDYQLSRALDLLRGLAIFRKQNNG
jgi:carboxyl-terminal processing protease